MSFAPAFEIGLWNAWLLVLPIIVISLFGMRVIGKRESGGYSTFTPKRKILGRISMAIIFSAYVYSVFLPLRMNTVWLYMGLIICIPTILIEAIAVLNFATTPLNKPVTKGVYRFSRNPMYIGEFLIYTGIGIACVSWVFLLVALIAAVLHYFFITPEEHHCLEKYGDEYREYMNRTSRLIGLPKSERKR